jgi:hypothetical protein
LVETLPETVRVLHDNQGDMTGVFGLSNFPVLVSITPQWTVAEYSHPSDGTQVLACLQADVAVEPAFSGNAV